MSIAQFLIMAAVSVLVTLPTVLFIPRDRASPAFDRWLWAATWVLAFLVAWVALGYANTDSSFSALNSFVIDQVSLIPTLIGAAVGALSLNLLLWIMDRFAQPTEADDHQVSRDPPDEEENAEKDSKGAN